MAKGNTIILYHSGVPGSVPSNANLSIGEIALNYADGLFFYRDANSNVQAFGSSVGAANLALSQSNAALVLANTANTVSVSANTLATSANSRAAGAFAQANSAFAKANTSVQVDVNGNANVSGNLGIGTINFVSAKLQVRGAGQNTASINTSSNLGATILIQDNGTLVNNGGAIVFGAGQGFFAGIKGLISDGSNNTLGDLSFSIRTSNSAASTLTEQFRLNVVSGPILTTVPALGDNTAKFAAMQSIMVAMQHIKVNVVTITANQTWTPDVNLIYATLETWGPGGGGGGATGSTGTTAVFGGGGGAGGYSRATVSRATVGASQTVTIGQAGAGGSSGSNPGTQGGNTSIGALCTANGGSGGAGTSGGGTTALGGPGGIKGIGDITANGASGFVGYNLTGTVISGAGASSIVGVGGAIITSTTGAGVSGQGNASGGSGGQSNGGGGAVAGGAGTIGIAVITQVCWA